MMWKAEIQRSLNDGGRNEEEENRSRQTGYLSKDDEEDAHAFQRKLLKTRVSLFDTNNETRQNIFPAGELYEDVEEFGSVPRIVDVCPPMLCARYQIANYKDAQKYVTFKSESESKVDTIETSQSQEKGEEFVHERYREAEFPVGVQGVINEEPRWKYCHIMKRECSHFISVPSHSLQDVIMDEDFCQCGYIYSKHSPKAQEARRSSQLEWDYQKHSKQIPTDAFGDIEFNGGKRSKYIRVDVDTKTSDMLNIMREEWKLRKPNLLISVTGGAKDFHMNKRLKETLGQCLFKTTLTTGAWIVTGGTHAGVMEAVGEAVNNAGVVSTSENQIICIGIASWGCIQNKKDLINKQERDKMYATYICGKEQNSKESFLDPNHTHFILVDNATQHKYGVELDFQVKLEKAIAETKKVLLVVNGGIGTLKTVSKSLQNRTPSVIVKGSGRAADILAHAYQNAKTENVIAGQKGNKKKKTRRFMDESLLKEIRVMLDEEFGRNSDTYVHQIEECLEKYDFLSVFELDSKSDVNEMDHALLHALCKANSDKVMYNLRLALAWDRIDVAKNDIFVDDRKWQTGSLDDLMLSAIQFDKTDFVGQFLDHGVKLRQFLTGERRRLLYEKMPTNCLLQSLLVKKNDGTPSEFGNFIKNLIGDSFKIPCIDRNPTEYERDKSVFENPSQELFLWSVLMLKQDMAKLFWRGGKDAIAGALVAYTLLGKMKMKAENTWCLDKLRQYIDEWSGLAVGVLSECYATDERKTQDLLVRELTNWGNKSCMQIALQGRNKDFISQRACRSMLSRIWMGKLAPDTASWRLIVCVLIPPLALVLPSFQNSDDNRSQGTDKHPANHEQDDTGPLFQTNEREAKQNNGPKKITVQDRIRYVFEAPVIISMGNLLSYLVFLGLYSYILLFNFNPSVSSAEIVLMVWVFTIFMEEIRQAETTHSKSLKAKFKKHVKDIWNKWDFVTLGSFAVGMFLRFFPNKETFDAARICLAINFVACSLRLLQIFSLHKILGPKLVMIGRMVKDLMAFLVILLVFIVSYAIASHSILFPNSPLRWSTASDVIRKSYWHIYGELFLEEIEGSSDCTNDEAMWINGTLPRCPSETGIAVASILLGLYMLLANILLLNLLIAMFSNTFALVQKKTNKYWCFQRCSLIYEYHKRPVLSPPLNIFWYIYLLLKCVYYCCCCEKTVPCASDTGDEFCRRFKNKDDDLEQEQWERVIADSYLKGRICEENDTNNLLKRIINCMDEIQEQQ